MVMTLPGVMPFQVIEKQCLAKRNTVHGTINVVLPPIGTGLINMFNCSENVGDNVQWKSLHPLL